MERDSLPKYIIEFNGLPGSGKTTVANELERLLKERGMTVFREYYNSRFSKNNKSIFLSLRWFASFVYVYAISLCIKPIKNRYKGVLAFVKYLRMYDQYVRNNRDAILITDEGLIQAVTSIYHRDAILYKDAVKRFFGIAIRKDIVVLRVDSKCDIDICFERISKRGVTGARLDVLNYDERREALNVQSENLSVIRLLSDQELKWDSVAVDTSLPPMKNAEIIIKKIAKDE